MHVGVEDGDRTFAIMRQALWREPSDRYSTLAHDGVIRHETSRGLCGAGQVDERTQFAVDPEERKRFMRYVIASQKVIETGAQKDATLTIGGK